MEEKSYKFPKNDILLKSNITKQIEYNGEKIYFYIQKKKIKNINLKVSMDQTITISIPYRVSLKMAKEFVLSKIDWIKKQQKAYEKSYLKKDSNIFQDGEIFYLLGIPYKLKIISDKNNFINIENNYIEIHVKGKYIEDKKYVKNIYEDYLKEYAKKTYMSLIIKYQKMMEKYKIEIAELEIRKMKTRWGTCIPSKKKIILNFSLIKSPIYCIEYVVLHELAHFKYQNHSKNFYDFINIFMPDWKERKRTLNKEYAGITYN